MYGSLYKIFFSVFWSIFSKMIPVLTLENNLPMCSFSEPVFFWVFTFIFKFLIHLEIILVMGEMYLLQFFSTWLFNYPSSVQSLSRVRLFVTPWIATRQASLSITNSRSPPKPMSIESLMPSNHLILCHPLRLLPSIFPNIRVFSNESALHIRWPKYWRSSFNISPSNEHQELITFRMDWLDLPAV